MRSSTVDLRSQGVRVEDYSRRLAGHMGVPDFVYLPKEVAKGAARREALEAEAGPWPAAVVGARNCTLAKVG